jgi:4-hydroxy-3-methylbut-2-enyl diphosphate reductase
LAPSAGFCFGVRRAVDMTYHLLKDGTSVSLLGPLIHNRQVMEDLQRRGAATADCPADCRLGDTVVIRAHGVPKETLEDIRRRGLPCCDATCPFVRKIHRIVEDNSAPGVPTLIAGDPAHPEVEGIRSYAAGDVFVFRSEAELNELLRNDPNWKNAALIAVAQTTFRVKEWKNCSEKIKTLCTNAKIFDTICNATQTRQNDARALAARCDAMVIIGDRSSSNTAKLKSVCEELCPSFLVEGCGELRQMARDWSSFRTIGFTAGASTPARIIKEVLQTMSELTNEIVPTVQAIPEEAVELAAPAAEATAQAEVQPEETEAAAPADAAAEAAPVIPVSEDQEFTAALEASLKGMNSDQKVKGCVTAINPSEIQVDIGRKQTGYVSVDEYSNDPTADHMKEVKVGDELDLIILKTNDAEGTIQLSKKRFDASKAWTGVIAAEEDGTVLEGKVVEVIKGGVLAVASGVRVFIPASQTAVPRNEPLEDLLHTTVRFKIIEVNRQRRRAVGSIRQALKLERQGAEEAFWNQAAVGQTYHGKVKSLTSYGAFVDVGGVDGMVHISELSWNRIKHPSEVVSVGDEIDVYIKSLDPEKKKISLGYKRTEDNPWEVLRREYPVGSVLTVDVVSLTSFGAFARVLPGIEGLIHISQIADRRIEKPQDELSVGQSVQVKLIGVDFDKKRVSLSIRALLEDGEAAEAPTTEEDEIVASSSSEE